MKVYLALALFASVAFAIEPDVTIKKADNEFLKKQGKVLSLFVGLGSDLNTMYHHPHTAFPYADAKYYKDPKVISHFLKSFERGLIDQHGVFTMYCHKNRHDTFHIFDIMYYAKDFDTFFHIAKWGRKELNPLQFFYAYTTAVLHREDTRGIYTPPIFEVFPHYFIQSFYMNEAVAYNTFHKDDQHVVHEVNATGWEHSWHNEMIGGIYPSGQRWNGDDFQSRISYFREDVGLANSFDYWSMRFAPWLSTDRYPDIHFAHRGEHIYSFFKWILDRYTLERMSYFLPAQTPFETDRPMPGYNGHITDYMGRSFLARSDNIVPQEVNPEGSWEVGTVEDRIQKAIDIGVFWLKNGEGAMNVSNRAGFDAFSKMIYSTRDSVNRPYYKSLYFKLLAAAKDVVKAPNDRDFTSSPLGFTMTQLRDPAFYMILTTIESWFEDFVKQFKPYTKEQLGFEGVSFDNFEVTKLITYNDRRKFEITNGLPFEHEEDRFKYRSFANHYTLDHEPFEYDFTIKSDKEQQAMIRVFIGPKRDADGKLLSLNQQRRAFLPLNKYIVKLVPGDNVFKKHSFQPEFYDTHDNFYDIYMKVNKSIESDTPYEYSELSHCGMPYNLMLPRGQAQGKQYSMFVIVTPYSEQNIHKDGFYQCRHNVYMDDYTPNFPFDRKIIFPNKFNQPNMLFKEVKVYHHWSKPTEPIKARRWP